MKSHKNCFCAILVFLLLLLLLLRWAPLRCECVVFFLGFLYVIYTSSSAYAALTIRCLVVCDLFSLASVDDNVKSCSMYVYTQSTSTSLWLSEWAEYTVVVPCLFCKWIDIEIGEVEKKSTEQRWTIRCRRVLTMLSTRSTPHSLSTHLFVQLAFFLSCSFALQYRMSGELQWYHCSVWVRFQ